jgi:hypothetical protein
MSFRESIAPHLQADVPPSQKQKDFDRLIKAFFPVTGDIENWKRQTVRLVNPGSAHVTDKERAITGAMVQKILDSGVFEELTKLRKLNAAKKAPRVVRHIPIEHWSENGDMSATAHGCSADVNAIVAAAMESNPSGSRFFMEGLDVAGLVSVDAAIESLAWTYEKRGINKDPSEARGLQIMKDTFPWIFDPTNSVYGAEHQAFYEIYTRYTDAQIYKERVSQASVNTFRILFSQLLREQIAVERALNTLQEGEEGYLVYGAGHTKSIERYIRTSGYRGVTHEVLVPRGLVIR